MSPIMRAHRPLSRIADSHLFRHVYWRQVTISRKSELLIDGAPGPQGTGPEVDPTGWGPDMVVGS